MTVTYSLACSTNKFGTFFRLLLKWRGSLYKLIYRELLLFLAVYFAISIMYRLWLNESQRVEFEKISQFCERYTTYIPLTFVLGFYVSMIVDRWWRMYCIIPWPDRFAIHAATYVEGNDERGKLLRRTLVRYLLAGSVITLRAVSAAVKKRFPTMQHLVEFGLLTEEELEAVERPVNVSRYWIPAQWCCTLLYKIRNEGRIKSDYLLDRLVQEAMQFRNNCGALVDYDWISIPLDLKQAHFGFAYPQVYTQVVTISVYSFFLACLLGRQYLNPAKKYGDNDIDLYFPWFTALQFIFYIGWLKVAETLMNPFGEDDDDFELNWIIERNVKIGFIQATEQHDFLPTLQKDIFWTDAEAELPHTAASVGVKDQGFKGSAAGVCIPKDDAETLSAEAVDAIRRKASAPPITAAFMRMLSRSPSREASRKTSTESSPAASRGRAATTGTAAYPQRPRDLSPIGLEDGRANGTVRGISPSAGHPCLTIQESRESSTDLPEEDASHGSLRIKSEEDDKDPLVSGSQRHGTKGANQTTTNGSDRIYGTFYRSRSAPGEYRLSSASRSSDAAGQKGSDVDRGENTNVRLET